MTEPIIHRDIEQGTGAWFDLHRGRPTVGSYSRIMTPIQMKSTRGETREKYIGELLEQWALHAAPMDVHNAWMERGLEQEHEARCRYAFEHDVEIEQVGFVERADGLTGGSPDGLIVGKSKGLEIKVLSARVHLSWLCNPDLNRFYQQCQGLMMITGYESWDLWLYHPTLPCSLHTFDRDDEYIERLSDCLGLFLSDLESSKRYLIKLGVEPWKPPEKCPHTGVGLAVCRCGRCGEKE